MNDSDFEVLEAAVRSLPGGKPTDVREIMDGGWNRLFRFELGGRSLMAKFYFRDDRERLHREFETLTLLSERGFAVPKAYVKDYSNHMGVYSFEPGYIKPARDLTDGDLEVMLDFVLKLHAITFDEVGVELPLTVNAAPAYQDYIDVIYRRLEMFTDALQAAQLHPKAVDFAARTNISVEVRRLVEAATANLDPDDLTRHIPIEAMRLNPGDFGAHNTLFEGQKACFIDFESTGWDDPCRLVAEFVNHAAHLGMSQRHKDYFLNRYRAESPAPKLVLDRLPQTMALTSIVWLVNHLFNVSPERIASRQFSDGSFDLNAHVESHIMKAQNRLKLLRSGLNLVD